MHMIIPPYLLDELRQVGREVRCKPRRPIWRQGQGADWVALVESGCVKLTRAWNSQRKTLLGVYFRGSLLGFDALAPESVRTAHAAGLTPCRVRVLPRRELLELASGDDDLGDLLLAGVLSQHQGVLGCLEAQVDGPLEQRLARRVLDLAARGGLPDARGIFVPAPLRTNELAQMVGCRPETVSRALTRWREGGVMTCQREGLVISDLERLERQAARLPPARIRARAC